MPTLAETPLFIRCTTFKHVFTKEDFHAFQGSFGYLYKDNESGKVCLHPSTNFDAWWKYNTDKGVPQMLQPVKNHLLGVYISGSSFTNLINQDSICLDLVSPDITFNGVSTFDQALNVFSTPTGALETAQINSFALKYHLSRYSNGKFYSYPNIPFLVNENHRSKWWNKIWSNLPPDAQKPGAFFRRWHDFVVGNFSAAVFSASEMVAGELGVDPVPSFGNKPSAKKSLSPYPFGWSWYITKDMKLEKIKKEEKKMNDKMEKALADLTASMLGTTSTSSTNGFVFSNVDFAPVLDDVQGDHP